MDCAQIAHIPDRQPASQALHSCSFTDLHQYDKHFTALVLPNQWFKKDSDLANIPDCQLNEALHCCFIYLPNHWLKIDDAVTYLPDHICLKSSA